MSLEISFVDTGCSDPYRFSTRYHNMILCFFILGFKNKLHIKCEVKLCILAWLWYDACISHYMDAGTLAGFQTLVLQFPHKVEVEMWVPHFVKSLGRQNTLNCPESIWWVLTVPAAVSPLCARFCYSLGLQDTKYSLIWLRLQSPGTSLYSQDGATSSEAIWLALQHHQSNYHDSLIALGEMIQVMEACWEWWE